MTDDIENAEDAQIEEVSPSKPDTLNKKAPDPENRKKIMIIVLIVLLSISLIAIIISSTKSSDPTPVPPMAATTGTTGDTSTGQNDSQNSPNKEDQDSDNNQNSKPIEKDNSSNKQDSEQKDVEVDITGDDENKSADEQTQAENLLHEIKVLSKQSPMSSRDSAKKLRKYIDKKINKKLQKDNYKKQFDKLDSKKIDLKYYPTSGQVLIIYDVKITYPGESKTYVLPVSNIYTLISNKTNKAFLP